MKPEPLLRADGRCYQCGKPRKIPKSNYARGEVEKDPFCQTSCCREYYGITDPGGLFLRTGEPEGRKKGVSQWRA